jgi:hypothetical protein
MKIEVLFTPNCPHYRVVIRMVREILAETGIQAQIKLVCVDSEADARRLKFVGSPTVRVDGLDVEPYVTFAAKGFNLRCRTYEDNGQVLHWPGWRTLKDMIEVGHLAELGMLSTCC